MLVLLLLIIFAIIDFGRLFFAVQGIKSASREGARAAIIAYGNRMATLAARISQSAEGAASALAGGGAALAAAWDRQQPQPGTSINVSSTRVEQGRRHLAQASGGDPITVAVSTPFTWFTPTGIFAGSVDTVRADTTMRCE